MKPKTTKVDDLTKILDKAFILPLDSWKLSTEMEADPVELSKIDFDDSQWRHFSIMEEDVFPNGCWLRHTVTIPKKIYGKPVDEPLYLHISINDIAELWVDGEYLGSWQWDHTVMVCKEPQKTQKIVILLKGSSNHPMYLFWLSQAYLILQSDKKLKELTTNLILSLQTAQLLLDEDTSLKNSFLTFDPGIDKSQLPKSKRRAMLNSLQHLAQNIDLKAIERGDRTQFLKSISKIKNKLSKYDQYAKTFTLFFVSNAHIDAAWLWREMEVVEVVKRTFSATLNLLNQHSQLTYTQTSALYYEWMEKKFPTLFKQMRKRIKEGRWEISGGMWIEPDCNMPDGESWAKQFLFAQQYFKTKFKKRATIGYNPDSFGYNWNLPQFLNKAGITYFVTQKINWNDTNVFPYRLFWWEAPDGSKVLTYLPNDYMSKIENPLQFIEFARQFELNTGFKETLFFFGIGDHGGGPSLQMLQRLESLKKLWVFPKIKFSTIEQYFEHLKKYNLSLLPVWKDELYMEHHRATYTTQAKLKELNRISETLLTNSEKLSSLTRLNVKSLLNSAWKLILFNQFHDILPGTSIYSVTLDAYQKYEKALTIGHFVLQKALKRLAKTINTKLLPTGNPLILFNLLNWKRENFVQIPLPFGDNNNYSILNEQGQEIPSQIVNYDDLTKFIIFKACVPAFGYRVYGLKRKKNTTITTTSHLRITKEYIENAFFKIEMDLANGSIKQIIDKRNNKELLTNFGNQLQLLENKVRLWKAWNINYTGQKFYPKFEGIEIVERGPIRVVYRSKYSFLKPAVRKPFPTEDFPTSFFTQDIILYDNCDLIEFKTEVDWWEDELILKVVFPLNINTPFATYEIPFGTIQRSTDLSQQKNKGKFEVPAIRWADLSEKEYGVSLINKAKYGYDVNKNVLRLTLLNAPLWPDPNANRGKHTIQYWLYPHQGDWKAANTKQKGYELNNKILHLKTKRHKGKEPLQKSFLQLKPSNIILTTIKFAEKSKNEIVLIWYESKGYNTRTELTLPFVPIDVHLSNFLEEEIQRIPFSGKKIVVKTKANETIVLKIKTNQRFF